MGKEKMRGRGHSRIALEDLGGQGQTVPLEGQQLTV